jgi:hypothetical protein
MINTAAITAAVSNLVCRCLDVISFSLKHSKRRTVDRKAYCDISQLCLLGTPKLQLGEHIRQESEFPAFIHPS